MSNRDFLRVFPVSSSKINMYIKPVILEKQFENCSTDYNWFFCGKPYSYIEKGILYKIIEISNRVSFFDPISGVTYKLKKGVDKCRVKIIDSNIKGDLGKSVAKSICSEFQGIVRKKNSSQTVDLICSEVEFIFANDVLEDTKKCPYVDYCKHHMSYNKLQKETNSSVELRNNFIESFK